MFHNEENIIVKIKPHWMGLVYVMFWYFISIILPILWWEFLGSQSELLLQFQWLFWLIISVYVMGLTYYIVLVVISWFGNHAYITNQRIFVTQHKLKSEKNWLLSLNNITDVSYYFPTRLAKMFGVGNVIVRTEKDRIILRAVPNPANISETILNLVHVPAIDESLIINDENVSQPFGAESALPRIEIDTNIPTIATQNTPLVASVAQNVEPAVNNEMPQLATSTPETAQFIQPDFPTSPQLVADPIILQREVFARKEDSRSIFQQKEPVAPKPPLPLIFQNSATEIKEGEEVYF